MKKTYKHLIILCLVLTLLFTSFIPNITGIQKKWSNKTEIKSLDTCDLQEDAEVTFYAFGLPGETSKQIDLPLEKVEYLQKKIESLQSAIANNPQSDETNRLIQEIIAFAKEHNLLPEDFSIEQLKPHLTQSWHPSLSQNKLSDQLQQFRVSKFFCNYVSTGSGSALPVIIFPRLVPVLLTPIPRLFVKWSVFNGVTSCGGLLTGTGFIASGQQQGLALGFWGIGFSVFLPPLMAYLLLGYALFVTVSAEEIEYWPPNYPPDINVVSPPDGSINIPISTSELRFYISDQNGDLMNYTVTTEPFVGSGSGSNKPDGTYSVPISDLEGSEEYIWHVQVSDGEDCVDEFFSFTTEMVAPIIYDPVPEDGARYVSADLFQLRFRLNDPQGDLMDYTVETSPDIGSKSGSGVGDGVYTVDVSGIDYTTEYTWYVNVTDGVNWKHKVFVFQTEPKMVFDPFAEGWHYRKELIIDHSKVVGDLRNFPMLVNTVDVDLRDKAQDDGDDILFMDGIGVATRLYHEIEYFDGSAGDLTAWVNATNLSSNEDTILYMYYGNPGSNDQQAPEKVWDSNYAGVWHMSEDSNNNQKDSTLHKHDLTYHGSPTSIDGKIGMAINFDGISDYFDHPNHADFLMGNDDFTFVAWINNDGDADTDDRIIFYKGSDGPNHIRWYSFWSCRKATSSAALIIDDDSTDQMVEGSSDLTDNRWHHIVGVRENDILGSGNDEIRLWIDGIEENNLNIGSYGSLDGIGRLYIGRGGINERFHKGAFDELYIIKGVAKSNNWVKTVYNNQNNPSGFLIFGPEETVP